MGRGWDPFKDVKRGVNDIVGSHGLYDNAAREVGRVGNQLGIGGGKTPKYSPNTDPRKQELQGLLSQRAKDYEAGSEKRMGDLYASYAGGVGQAL